MTPRPDLHETVVMPDSAPSHRTATDDRPFADTQLAPDALSAASAVPVGCATDDLLAARRTTVLPRSAGERTSSNADTAPRYRAERVLGRGGMGEVLLATDRDIGRSIAVKRALGDAPELLGRFVDEIRVMGQLEHPNIAGIYDVDVDAEGRLFFTMRFVRGESLADVIERLAAGDVATLARYPLARRLDIFVDVLDALSHAHRAGLVHRDVKPENVMLGADGVVVVTDWGIARDVGPASAEAPIERGMRRASDTGAGGVIGTPLYMAPEQAAGKPTDARADLYSAFVLLFELLTLRPFVRVAPDEDVLAVLAASVTRAPPSVFDPVYAEAQGQPAVPAELRHFLARGLQNQREQRFQSAEEALSTLARLRSGEVPIGCPITLVKSTQNGFVRWLERWPRLSLALGGLALVLVLVGAVVLVS